MALLDKYRGKGYIPVSSLPSTEREELEALTKLSKEETESARPPFGINLCQYSLPGKVFLHFHRYHKIVAFESVSRKPSRRAPGSRTKAASVARQQDAAQGDLQTGAAGNDRAVPPGSGI